MQPWPSLPAWWTFKPTWETCGGRRRAAAAAAAWRSLRPAGSGMARRAVASGLLQQPAGQIRCPHSLKTACACLCRASRGAPLHWPATRRRCARMRGMRPPGAAWETRGGKRGSMPRLWPATRCGWGGAPRTSAGSVPDKGPGVAAVAMQRAVLERWLEACLQPDDYPCPIPLPLLGRRRFGCSPAMWTRTRGWA